MKEKLITSLHHVVPSTPVTHVGVHVQQTLIQLGLVTNPILVS